MATKRTSANTQSRHHECALCLEKFKSPRILPCFHTFCLECLKQLPQKIKGSNTFACPTCRVEINIPPKGIEAFHINFYIEDEVEVTVSHKCEMCKETDATHKCLDCDKFACENCIDNHSTTNKASSSHKVVNFDSLKSGKPSHSAGTKDRFCSEHPSETLRFYCTYCSAVICRDCKLTDHERHTTTDLSKMATGTRGMLSSLSKVFNEVLQPKLEEVLDETLEHQITNTREIKQIEDKMKQEANEIIQEVQKCLNNALKNLIDENYKIRKTMSNRVEGMLQQLEGFQSLCQHMERVAQNGCDADILQLPSQVADFFGMQGTLSKGEVPRRSCMSRDMTNASQVPRLSHFTDKTWRNATDVFRSENRRSQLQYSLTYYRHETHAQKTSDISTLSTQIENYIEKLQRAKRKAIEQNTALNQGVFHPPYHKHIVQHGELINQEIRKIQQILSTWKARPEKNAGHGTVRFYFYDD